jgi:hypothetical protein
VADYTEDQKLAARIAMQQYESAIECAWDEAIMNLHLQFDLTEAEAEKLLETML